MKKKISVSTAVALIVAVILVLTMGNLSAKAEDTIYKGIYIESVDVSGMTREQALEAVNQYLDDFRDMTVIFKVASGESIQARVGDFNPKWENTEIIDTVMDLANEGNVVQRYKAIKDIQHNGMYYEIQVSFDDTAIEGFLNDNGVQYDVAMENPTLVRENGEFRVEGGASGQALNVAEAVSMIDADLFDFYKEGEQVMELPVDIVEPDGDATQLTAVKDIIGTYTTSYSTSGKNRSTNVENGCRLVNGSTLFPGEEISFYEKIKPFTASNGYLQAPSYMNGTVVETYGGGICQVSSTLYNAVLQAELEVTERYPHSMIVTYVPKSADAAISENNKDFKFVNNTDYPIYIEGITEGKKVTFNIYGVETRPENRKVEYVSEQISENIPTYENIIADAGAVVGSVSVTAAHIGYKARLWKVVYVDGVEVSRDQVNSSTYNASPRTARVGVATSDPDAYNRIIAAIASGSIDMCRATAAAILSGN